MSSGLVSGGTWQKALICAVGQKCDWTDKSYLEPLLKYIEEL